MNPSILCFVAQEPWVAVLHRQLLKAVLLLCCLISMQRCCSMQKRISEKIWMRLYKTKIRKKTTVLKNLRFTGTINDCSRCNHWSHYWKTRSQNWICSGNYLLSTPLKPFLQVILLRFPSVSCSKKIVSAERVAGLHFFNPGTVMKLVEVVKGDQTSDATIHQLVELTRHMNKVVVVCKDAPGFIVNRGGPSLLHWSITFGGRRHCRFQYHWQTHGSKWF